MRINQKKAGILLSYLGIGIQSIVSILYTPFMIRLLGQSEYGTYNLVFSVVSYLGLLSFGFSSAYVRFHARLNVAHDDAGIARLNGMFMIVFIIISGITLLAGSVLVANVEIMFKNGLTPTEIATARVLMILMVINLALTFPASTFDSYIIAHEHFFFQRMITLLRNVLNPFLCLPLLLMGFKSVSLVVVTTSLTVASLILNAWYCLKKLHMKFSYKKLPISLFKEVWIFCFYIFIGMIVDQINWSTDKFLLGIFASSAAVAIYAVAGQLNTYYRSFSTSISSVFIPQVNRIVAETDDTTQLTDLMTRVGRIQCMVMALFCFGIIFFGQPFIRFFAGAGYEESYPILLLLVLPATIPLIQNLGIEIQRAKNLHKFRSIVYLLVAVANIFVSIPLIKLYGASGAAIGTALTLIIGNIIAMNFYYHMRVKLNMVYFWKNILKLLPAMIPPCIVGYLCMRYVNLYRFGYLILAGIIYVLVYCLSMWMFAMQKSEKELLIVPMRKLFARPHKHT
nr:oligosaccharide flippase family protein [Maliibacterium massiliense]